MKGLPEMQTIPVQWTINSYNGHDTTPPADYC